MEIEAKFRVENADIFAALTALHTLGPFTLTPAATVEEQHNTYLDTGDQRLRAQRYGLRVRDLGTRRIATLKGSGRVDGALHEREEWEVEIGDSDQPRDWPPGELRNRVLALVGDAALQPTVTTHTRRQHIYATREGVHVAELSLDEGTISAGRLQVAFREVEVELVPGGSRTDLLALIALLRDRFPLVPEARSKLARGLALLDAA